MADVCTIRRMHASDLVRILEIERTCFITPWTEKMFLGQLLLEDISINLVLVEGDLVIGYLTAWVAYDEIHILSIAVVPGRRRMGHGKRLMDEAIASGRRMGGGRVILEVRENNPVPQRFYRTYGFRVIGRRKRYYHDTGEDALVMELCLDDEQ